MASEGTMRPKERRDTGQTDLLRSRLDAIIDMNHALVKLARTIDWSFLERQRGGLRGQARPAAIADPPDGRIGHPTFPMRCCASAGWRTLITNSSAARSSSST